MISNFVYLFHAVKDATVICGCIGRMAEWSKALALGASPKGRGFEPHSCHFWISVSFFQIKGITWESQASCLRGLMDKASPS